MKKNKFIEGTLFAYIVILLTKIIGAVYVIPLREIIGEAGGVLYGYAYQVYTLFLDISTSGIPTAISIIIAEFNALKMFNEREYTFKVANKLISVISVIAFTVMFLMAKPIAMFFVDGINNTPESISSIVLVIRVIAFCLLVIPFLSITRGYLQGNRYAYASSSSQLVEQVVRVVVALVGSYVAINILCLSMPIGVAITLSGTVLGGLAAYLLLRYKIHKNKAQLMEGVTSYKDSTVSAKEIIIKIAKRAIPVIIIASIQNIYNIVDLKLLMQGLSQVGFSPEDCEVIGSVVVTWTPKICMLINSIAVSMCLSIIPFIVNSFVNNDKEEVNSKFNQAMSTILYIAVPLSVFMYIFGKEIYSIFYVDKYYGGLILGANAITSVFFSLQMVMDMMLQGMKNYKLVYINTVAGLLTNILLDIPMILLLKNLGVPPYIGTIFATFFGLLVSIIIIMIGGRKKYGLNYKTTFKSFFQIIFATVIMAIVAVVAHYLMPVISGRIMTVIILGIFGIVAMAIYIVLTLKMGTMDLVLGKDFLKNLLNKFKKKQENN